MLSSIKFTAIKPCIIVSPKTNMQALNPPFPLVINASSPLLVPCSPKHATHQRELEKIPEAMENGETYQIVETHF